MKYSNTNFLLSWLFIIVLTGCITNYDSGIEKYQNMEYEKALTYLKKVEITDENYEAAQIKISEIDSLLTEMRIEKAVQDSIARAEAEKKELVDFKAQLSREIDAIKTFDGSTYRDNVTSIQMEVVIFGAWAKIIKDAENHYDKEVNKSGRILKSKVVYLQKIEFPKMRKSYGEVLKSKLWAENIKVKTIGSRHTTLEFEGALFANNKNKQDTQQTLSEILNMLRFKRVNYKWYEYDNEYTYYTLNVNPDGDLVEFK